MVALVIPYINICLVIDHIYNLKSILNCFIVMIYELI